MKEFIKLLTVSDKITKWFIWWSVIFSLGVYAIIGKDIVISPLPKHVGYILVGYAIFIFFQPIYKWLKGKM